MNTPTDYSPALPHPVLIDMPMPIITPRLILRPAQTGDGMALHEATCETWDQLSQWLPWAKTIGTPAESEIVVRQAYARFILREDFFALGFCRDTGELLLASGLHRFDWQIRRFEIGYWVRKSAQNKGLATECAHALTRYAFEVLNARAVVIDVAQGNEASLRVPQKLDFVQEGIAQYGLLLPSGQTSHAHIYVRTDLANLPPLTITWGVPETREGL